MTQRQTTRSRVLRRVGVALAAAIAVSTVATASGNAARVPQKPKVGGEVKVAIFDTIAGWCVGDNNANSSLMAVRTVYETLFEKTIGGDLVGALAKDATPSADLKTWTVTLRSGIKFHDGTDMKATDVKYGLDVARGYQYIAGGAQAKHAYMLGTAVPFLANVTNITASADSTGGTLTFTLFRAQNDFTSTLYASGRFFVRGRAQVDPAQNNANVGTSTCSTKPIGTGPFKVASDYTLNADQLVVYRNPDYWRTDAYGTQLPYLDKITFDNIKDTNSRSRALQSSYKGASYDVGMFTGGEGTFVKNLRLKKKLLTEYKSKPEYYPSLWFNEVIQPQFKYASCRNAVSYGIDRVAYAKVRTKGETVPAKSLVGPTSVMYTTKGFAQYNKAKAKAALAQCLTDSGKSDLTFTIPADTSNVSLQNAKYIAQQLAKVGITMNIIQREAKEIISTAFNAAKGNQYDAIIILLLEGTDVGFNLPFLVTNSFATGTPGLPATYLKGALGSILNLNRHTDTQVDTLLYAAQALPNNTKAEKAAVKKAFAAATQYIQEQGLMTSVSHGYYTLFAKKNILGIGKLKLPSGKTQRVVTNWGIDWTGVYKK
jgi:peptide/nickel transport system substrate-binding protein